MFFPWLVEKRVSHKVYDAEKLVHSLIDYTATHPTEVQFAVEHIKTLSTPGHGHGEVFFFVSREDRGFFANNHLR